MTENQVPPASSATAAAAGERGAPNLGDGPRIDPDQSTMIPSAAPPGAPAPAWPAPWQVTVTMACTSVAPASRYSFSKTSAVQVAIGVSLLVHSVLGHSDLVRGVFVHRCPAHGKTSTVVSLSARSA